MSMTPDEMTRVAQDLQSRFSPEVLSLAGTFDFVVRSSSIWCIEAGALGIGAPHHAALAAIFFDWVEHRAGINVDEVRAACEAIAAANRTMHTLNAMPEQPQPEPEVVDLLSRLASAGSAPGNPA